MDTQSRIYVAGHRGLVGSAVCRALVKEGYTNILSYTRSELDLCNQVAVAETFAKEKPEYVFVCAAKVGGIYANDIYSADFIYENLQMQNALIHNAWKYGVKKLLFLGSSCIYPKACPQPIKEEYLLTGALEPTNSAYAVAKIAGLEMCAAYRKQYGFDAISVMPTNLYGPGDNYHAENAHVIPALIGRFHGAKEAQAPQVAIWGTGTPRREFLHVDDLAAACLLLMRSYSESGHINVGCGEDMTILTLAHAIAKAVGYTGEITLDTSKPDGTMRKVLDTTKITALGWRPQVSLEEGLREAYADFLRSDVRK